MHVFTYVNVCVTVSFIVFVFHWTCCVFICLSVVVGLCVLHCVCVSLYRGTCVHILVSQHHLPPPSPLIFLLPLSSPPSPPQRSSSLFPLTISSSLSLCSAMQCREVAGQLRQIDVSGGQVFGTNADDAIFTLYRDCWTQVPGALKHITVGPSGIWGVNSTNAIFKLVNANWVQVPGQLNQIDAGGVQFVAGVNTSNNIRCLGQRYLGSPVFWQDIPGSLKYCSCGPQGCWGVDNSENIYVLLGVTTQQCQGTGPWQQVNGSLSMLEVGSDGSVYGVNHAGDIYHRDGITSSNPAGTGWTFLRECGKSKHVSFDQGHLWVITQDNQIMDCS
ncbi:FEL protein, partial [Amia calva]|nr:FEL protein [Amia calva]